MSLRGAPVHQSLGVLDHVYSIRHKLLEKKSKHATKMTGSLRAHMEKRQSKFWVSHPRSLGCPIKFANRLEARRSKAQLFHSRAAGVAPGPTLQFVE